MSGELEPMDTTETKPGIDRRSALKKAAAAGVIAWTVPTITSGTASAAVICTPKCAPVFTLSGSLVEGYQPFPGNKAARVSLNLTPNPNCPCSGGVPATLRCEGIPNIWNKDGTGQSVIVAPTTPAPGYDVAFYVAKTTGALGAGTWTISPTATPRWFIVGFGCVDRTGDTIWYYCQYNVSFVFEDTGPSGNVVSYSVELAPIAQPCGTTCNVAPASCSTV